MAFTAAGIASTVFELSKTACGLGIILLKLDQDAQNIDSTVRNLVDQVRLLGVECDLVYSELAIVCNSPSEWSLRHDCNHKTWQCIGIQVEEVRQTMQELGVLVQHIKDEAFNSSAQEQHQWTLNSSRIHLVDIAARARRHSSIMRTTLLLITTALSLAATFRLDPPYLENPARLQALVQNLQRFLETELPSALSHTEIILVHCAQEVIAKATASLEANSIRKLSTEHSEGPNSSVPIMQWIYALESIHENQKSQNPSDEESGRRSIVSGEGAHGALPGAVLVEHDSKAIDVAENDLDDDLAIDLLNAALDTSNAAFEAQEWIEAESLLQEALRILQELPIQRSSHVDVFNLHYKLAVCAYYVEETMVAEEALASLIRQQANNDTQSEYIYNAIHLLSLLCTRTGQIDRARVECEKAFKGRRRLLGKQSDASLESTALMAHIYVLLGNRALAKSCLAMIPVERRDSVVEAVERSLGTATEHLDFPTMLNRTLSDTPDSAPLTSPSESSRSIVESPKMDAHLCSRFSTSTLSAENPWQEHNHTSLHAYSSPSVPILPRYSSPGVSSEKFPNERLNDECPASSMSFSTLSLAAEEAQGANGVKIETLSRKEVLDKIGCQPRDRVEVAVCNASHSSLATLLSKKTNSWRSKLRKHARSERVTALHFAALFGEIEMAQLLLAAHFNINEVPYGYSTSLTPLHFAIGARQVDMVRFLIANGARPCEQESWSTLASQLLSRSWLMKTMSEAEKEHVPTRAVAILTLLLKAGWDVNAPYESSGKTLLHQAVTFWTGSYTWDLAVRVAMSSFLCECGANPFQADAEGHTPHDKATADGSQDLLLILSQASIGASKQSDFAELPG